jgi:hypothetical protein
VDWKLGRGRLTTRVEWLDLLGLGAQLARERLLRSAVGRSGQLPGCTSARLAIHGRLGSHCGCRCSRRISRGSVRPASSASGACARGSRARRGRALIGPVSAPKWKTP